MNLLLIAAVVVGTWNGNWFPSGRAEHRAHPDVERATTVAAGRMLAEGFRRLDPKGTNDWILCLNEIRGPRAASNLIAQVGRADLKFAVISAYRRRDRYDMQQDVIATTLPVAETGAVAFPYRGKETPPRGYSYAALVVRPSVTAAVYAVHLKSDYGAKTADDRRLNEKKRAAAVRNVLADERKRAGGNARARPLILVGDFNADRWHGALEEMFSETDAANLGDVLAVLPLGSRWTHPNRKYGNSALDHVFQRGFRLSGRPKVVPNDGLSDHYALFALLTNGE